MKDYERVEFIEECDLHEMLAQIEDDYSGYQVYRGYGADILFSADAMANYLQISIDDFKKLVEGKLYDGYEKSFPRPISLYHYDFWVLREVRAWELAEACSRSRYEAMY